MRLAAGPVAATAIIVIIAVKEEESASEPAIMVAVPAMFRDAKMAVVGAMTREVAPASMATAAVAAAVDKD
jgi:hypothetical protein